MIIAEKMVIAKGSNYMGLRVERKESQIKALTQVGIHRKAVRCTVSSISFDQIIKVVILTPM